MLPPDKFGEKSLDPYCFCIEIAELYSSIDRKNEYATKITELYSVIQPFCRP
ncbi:MAG: hypothetical protein K0R28_4719 [Paenibacillus sp.]|nr:hypothetical protein [Paenibacillus sp.]